MVENLYITYSKEEGFLDKFGILATVAAAVLNGEWDPNYFASDITRGNQEYFFTTGELRDLVFDSASIYHAGKNFSSVQIVLKSSYRIVVVRVAKINRVLAGEKIVDRPLNRR